MNKSFLAALFFICARVALATWPGVEYAEVRAYYLDPSSPGKGPIAIDGKLQPNVADREGATLNADQTKRLIAAITSQVLYSPAKCYIPRHWFVFYDHDRKPVAVVEICLECMEDVIKPHAEGFVDFPAVADLLEELKLPLGDSFTDAKTYRNRRKSWLVK